MSHVVESAGSIACDGHIKYPFSFLPVQDNRTSPIWSALRALWDLLKLLLVLG